MSKNQTPDGGKGWRVETAISILSLLVSFGALLFTLIYNLSPGAIQPLKPSGYAIIRGIGWFPSDHLVIPIEWVNDGGRPALIRHPRLILRELDDEGKETGKEYRFFLTGEYPDISSNAFKEEYSVKRSFTLEPHSVSLRVLVFHIENWWDDKGDLFNFKFKSGQTFRVYIVYQRDLEAEREVFLFDMPVYGCVDNLDCDRTKGYWWDFWAVE